MAKLRDICKPNRRASKSSGYIKRFYSSRDMSEVKHMIANRNSQVKRGEAVDYPNGYIAVCGCGHEGCFIVSGYNNPLKLDYPK